MREIKFRAWDKENKRWFENELKWVGFALFGECTMFCMPSMEEVSRLEISQFTGLADKNGREIYEGDILKCGENDGIVVGWSDIHSSFSLTKQGWVHKHYFGEAMDGDQCEVLGNIYENPEPTGATKP